ncbi:MAG: YARHG domain-containing protein [Anaerovoracaceae bacterium]
MVRCKNCGARFNEEVRYCSSCGAPIEKEKGNLKWVLLGAGIVIVLALAALLIWNVFLRGNDSADEESTVNVPYSNSEHSDIAETGTYILENSDIEYISEAVIRNLSDWELVLARNEIYARNGRIFNDKDIRDYFMSQDWYEGNILPDDFTEDMLNEIEKTNVERIVAEEERRG